MYDIICIANKLEGRDEYLKYVIKRISILINEKLVEYLKIRKKNFEFKIDIL